MTCVERRWQVWGKVQAQLFVTRWQACCKNEETKDKRNRLEKEEEKAGMLRGKAQGLYVRGGKDAKAGMLQPCCSGSGMVVEAHVCHGTKMCAMH